MGAYRDRESCRALQTIEGEAVNKRVRESTTERQTEAQIALRRLKSTDVKMTEEHSQNDRANIQKREESDPTSKDSEPAWQGTSATRSRELFGMVFRPAARMQARGSKQRLSLSQQLGGYPLRGFGGYASVFVSKMRTHVCACTYWSACFFDFHNLFQLLVSFICLWVYLHARMNAYECTRACKCKCVGNAVLSSEHQFYVPLGGSTSSGVIYIRTVNLSL